jgi:hypothetical protein
MKIILSRKGFDSSSGGVPSPIFQDGKMLSLPIPSKKSSIKYKDVRWEHDNLGNIVEQLTNNKIKSNYLAHLDPDINPPSIKRANGWTPLFGQVSAAQGHLSNQSICKGDLFLFFGLFRNVITTNNRYCYDPKTLPKHVIWGWLQIEDIIKIDTCDRKKLKWALYHPHFHREEDHTNTLYVASKYLSINRLRHKIPGAGVFKYFHQRLQLTQNKSKNVSSWQLPGWFYPDNGKPPLTYHLDKKRWTKMGNDVILNTVGKGQEFVLDCSFYEQSEKWLKQYFDLFQKQNKS